MSEHDYEVIFVAVNSIMEDLREYTNLSLTSIANIGKAVEDKGELWCLDNEVAYVEGWPEDEDGLIDCRYPPCQKLRRGGWQATGEES